MKRILFSLITILIIGISNVSFGQTILITGANKGIGLALVKEYLKNQETVIATTRSIKKSDELQKLKGDRLQLVEVDLLDETSIETIKNVVRDQRIDVIIHNAGFFPYNVNNAPNLNTQEWINAFLVHTIRPTQITLALQDNLKKSSQPKVIAISSRRGSFSQNFKDKYSGRYGYRSSKAAMNSAMQALALDFQDAGITVLLLHPGRVATEMTKYDGISTEESASLISKTIKSNDIKNTGSYIDVTTGEFIEG